MISFKLTTSRTYRFTRTHLIKFLIQVIMLFLYKIHLISHCHIWHSILLYIIDISQQFLSDEVWTVQKTYHKSALLTCKDTSCSVFEYLMVTFLYWPLCFFQFFCPSWSGCSLKKSPLMFHHNALLNVCRMLLNYRMDTDRTFLFSFLPL